MVLDSSSTLLGELAPVITPLLPPNPPENSRNSEGDFALLADGRLLFAYSHFSGICHNDHEPAFLAGRISEDLGETWTSTDHVVLPNDGGMNVMGVTFLRTLDDKIALFYNRKNSVEDCRMHMRVSSDEGGTWSAARLCIPESGYYPVNNDRVIRISGGRLVVPAGRHGTMIDRFGELAVADRSVATTFYSDNDGVSWQRSKTILEGPESSVSGLQEPGVVELKDGRLMMWMRTDQGCQYQSHSTDGGETWSPAIPSNIISPLSPASIKRIPQTGDLLLIWNDHQNIDERRRGRRTPLCTAISDDDGLTWKHRNVLEDKNLDGYYCYTAIEFIEDSVILAYCAGDQGVDFGGLDQTNIARLNIDWLYS